MPDSTDEADTEVSASSLEGIVREANAFAGGKGEKGVVKKKGRRRQRLPPPLQWRFPLNIVSVQYAVIVGK